MKKLTIAIDGPAAAGKSTIAKKLANTLDYTYIDTGAMYRCVAYYLFNNGIDIKCEKEIEKILPNIDIYLKNDGTVWLNNQEVTAEIRKNEVSIGASEVAKYASVRNFLVKQQQQMASFGGVILDGRDIGTVVLPNADLKIFQIASVKARAKRRYLENINRNIECDLESIENEIQMRDENDMNRKVSPLKKADDAVEIDTSLLSIDEVLEIIMKLVKERLER